MRPDLATAETSPVPILPSFYTAAEERLNILTHGLGLLLSIVGLVLLIVRAASLGTAIHVTSFAIFGASLITLYAASTIYHSTHNPDGRVLVVVRIRLVVALPDGKPGAYVNSVGCERL